MVGNASFQSFAHVFHHRSVEFGCLVCGAHASSSFLSSSLPPQTSFSEVVLNDLHEIQGEYEISASAAEPPFLGVNFHAAAMPPSRPTCGRTGLHASGQRESLACVIGPTFSPTPATLHLGQNTFGLASSHFLECAASLQ